MTKPIPLRRYLSLQMTTITLIPAAIIAVLFWLFLMPQMQTSIGLQHQSLARVIAGEMWAYLMGGERQLVTLADVLVAKEGYSASQLTSLLDASCGEGELFETIYIVDDADQTIRYIGLARPSRSRREDLLGIDISGRDLYLTAREEVRTIWSQTFLSTVSSHLAVAVAVPLPGRLIVGEITLDKLSEFISQLPVEAGLLTLVLDGQGRVAADSQRKRSGQRLTLAGLPLGANEGETAAASRSFSLDGTPMVGSIVAVERLGWRVLVAQNTSAAFKPIAAVFATIATGLAVGLIVALALAWLQARKIANRTRGYIWHAKAIAAGRYDHDWPPSKTLEYQELADSLGSMAEKIRRREAQLVASEAHMRITLDSIGDGVIVTDTGGMITRLNPVAEKLTAWPSGEATGRPLLEIFNIVDSDTGTKIDDPVERVLTCGCIKGLADHTRLMARDGCEYQIANSGAPIRHADGEITGVVLVFRDITERYTQEAKIKENERRLQELTANVPGVVFLFQSTRQHEYSTSFVSEKVQDILGLSPDPQSFFTAFRDGIPGEEKEEFNASIRTAVNEVSAWHYEGRYIKPGGETIWFSANSIPREEEEDAIIFFGMLMDITQRKSVEESLRITQFSFDNAAIGIHRVAADGRILEVNTAAARMLGYTKEEMVTLSVCDINPFITNEIKDAIWQTLRVQGEDHFETVHRRKDGSEIPVEIRSNFLEYDGQQYAIIFIQDITERKQAESDLRQLRNYLSNIINSMPSILVGVDREGKVTQWNKQAQLATGLAYEKAHSHPLERVFPRLSDQKEHIETAIREARVIKDLKRPRSQSEKTYYEDVTIFPLVANGVEGAVIRVDDVTERVRMEEMMIQSEKMLSVGGLAAGMAHEINNPLAGILQNADVLNNRLFIDLPANRIAAETAGITMAAIQHYLELRKLPDMIANIRSSGIRASKIVKNMLGFARKSDHSVSSHDLCTLLDQTITLVETDYDMKQHYDFKKIRIVRAYDEADTHVPCEASKVQQVLFNLLKNGAEAMASEVDRKKSPIFTLSVKNHGNWVQIEVEDNGPGMDEKTRRSVFEPFFTTKPVGKGTGLGLSVSYFIITEDHGGEMEAQAAEGGGTRFIIRLLKEGKAGSRDVNQV